MQEKAIVYSKSIRAGKRTYFFDVKETAGGEYYLSVTESKRMFDKNEGNFYYKKHSLFIYKETLDNFMETLNDVVSFIQEEQPYEASDNEKYNEHYGENNEQNTEPY